MAPVVNRGKDGINAIDFIDYKIVPSVSGNNLTVAIKHTDGTDPSTDRPIKFKLKGEIRTVTYNFAYVDAEL